ncbi:AsmA-like C-terminal domain-containing protein [Bauldia sp.]|uniref:YhdP family protein n=1 Tax=Bauldia sp. TaxID=2575872 RepID=UPI003BAD8F38
MAFAASALAITGFVAIAVTLVVLLSGPVEVGFIRDRVVGVLAHELGHRVDIGRATVRLVPGEGLIVSLDDVTVVGVAGGSVGRVPNIEAVADPVSVATGGAGVRSVTLTGAELLVSGARMMGPPSAEMASYPHGGFPGLADALHRLDAVLADVAAKARGLELEVLTVEGATIVIADTGGSAIRRFDDLDASLTIDQTTADVALTVSAAAQAGRWSASLDYGADPDGDRVLAAAFSQVGLADLVPVLARKDNLASSDIPLFGRGSVRFDANGGPAAAELRLDVGAGVFTAGESGESILLDEATVNLRWDVAGEAILLDRSPLHFGATRGSVVGWVRAGGDPGSGRYAVSLESEHAVLAAPDAEAPPLTVERLALSGAIDLAAETLAIDALAIESAEGSLDLSGTIGFGGVTPSLALSARLSQMPVAVFKQMWVPFLAPGARRWVNSHIVDGQIAAGSFAAAVPAGMLWVEPRPPVPDDALRLDLRLEDVAFRTMGDLPPVVDASGNVVLAGAVLGVDVESARLDTRFGPVTIDAGAFAIDDVFDPVATGVVEVEASAQAAALGALADAEPLNALRRQDIAPSDLSGDAAASISLRLPLDKEDDELGEAMDWRVVVAGTGLGSAQPIDGRLFNDADLAIAVARDSVTVEGTAVIDGIAANVSMALALDADGNAVAGGAQSARLLLDQAARERLGLGVEDLIEGVIDARISARESGEGQHVDLDLTPARLTIPGTGWTKGVGVPATLSFDLVPTDGGQLAEDIVLAGDGFAMAGWARFSSEDGLVDARIDHLALRPDDDLSVDLTATPTGYVVDIRGAQFDARGLISDITTAGDDDLPDLSITADIDVVTGFNGEALTGLRGRFVTADGAPMAIALNATLGGAVALDFDDAGQAAALQMTAPDAGDLLRFLDLYTRVAGGQLTLEASRFGPTGPLDGQILIDDFVILEEPAVERAIASAPTPQDIDTSRLHFDRMAVQFGATSEAIVIDEALLRGQSVGATFSGRFDLERSEVAVNGTYLPLFALNNAFGRVPVIGRVLGGNREGLIGVTFRIEGPLDGPTVYFNPLSAVTPGIFRKIFEFR